MLDELMCFADYLFLDKIKDKAKLDKYKREYYSSTIYNNRMELVDELYKFCMKYIDCDLWEIHISLDQYNANLSERELENKKYCNFKCYFDSNSYHSSIPTPYVHCWGGTVDIGYYGTKLVVNNNYVEHEFVFKDHGYGNANQVSAYEIMMELNKRINGEFQTNVDKKEVRSSSSYSTMLSAINNAVTGVYTPLYDNDKHYSIRVRDIFICSHEVWINSERYKWENSNNNIKDI